MSRRWIAFCLGMILPLAGCAAGGRMTGLRPDAIASRPTPKPIPALAELATSVNRNARAVHALRASTTVSASGSKFGGGVSGQMALERPRNFKMELERGLAGSTVVDVGSNEEEFWFWMKDSDKKAVYVGKYNEQGEQSSEFLFHPDWIVEALGLRAMTSSELAQSKLTKGREPNTLVVTHTRPDGRGGSRLKQTVFDESTRQIKQHIFYASDGKTKIAEVFPSSFKRYTLASADNAPSSTIELPQRIQLRLTPPTRDPKDQVFMDIALRNIELNPKFTNVNRQALFTVPNYPGYEVVELTPQRADYAAERGRQYEPDAPSRRASHDVMLEEPVPYREDGAWLHRRDPLPLSADLGDGGMQSPQGVKSLVRPGIPEPPVVR